MATPIIRINSASGSDTNESGAGPGDGITAGSALNGTSASWALLVVTLDGSPDLSAVATDGSHVIYLVTDSGRKFFTINAVDDTAKTVTVDDTIAGSTSSLTWGIGGTRASLFSAATMVLTDSTPDVKSLWIIELASGHSETSAARNWVYGAGLTIRGESGAATRPILTQTSNAWTNEMMVLKSNDQRIESLDFQVDTVTSASCIEPAGTAAALVDIRATGVNGGTWHKVFEAMSGGLVTGCHIANCTTAVEIQNQQWRNANILYNYFEGTGVIIVGTGSTTTTGMRVVGNIINGGTTGLEFDNTRTDNIAGMTYIEGNTFYNQSANGISVLETTSSALSGMSIVNNLFSVIGGYGILFGNTAEELNAAAMIVYNNAFYDNTTDSMSETLTVPELGTVLVTADPLTTAGSDWSLNNNTPGGAQCRGAGYPSSMDGIDTNVSIGAIQLAAGGGGGSGGGTGMVGFGGGMVG